MTTDHSSLTAEASVRDQIGRMRSQAGMDDRKLAEVLVGELIDLYGLDTDDEHLEDTPRRVVESRLDEIFRGVGEDPREHLRTTFSDVGQYQGDGGWVIIDGIQVQSTCAHHWLPFRGRAHVGYIPTDSVVGLSKIPRMVDGYARRPQVQERLTNQVADAVHDELNPLATIAVIEAEHECMSLRGVKEPHSMTRTSALRGEARPTDGGEPHLKEEFFDLVNNGGR